MEWPTIGVAMAIGAGFSGVLLGHRHLPVPITLALLAVLGAWYGSLQHEVIHGHPTPWRWVNVAFAMAPLGLFITFGRYRTSHLQHHRDVTLTDPLHDPESYYVSEEEWSRCGSVHRWFLHARRTLAGRMAFGPAVTLWRTVRDIAHPASGRDALRSLRSVAGVAAVLSVVRATGLPLWQYVVGAGYLAQSLSLVRSFAEHRSVPDGAPTAIVHGGWFWRTLFLNNNLHLTHHRRPAVSWYRLPAVHREMGLEAEAEAEAGAGVYRGYGQIMRRHLFRPFGTPVVPQRLP